MERQQESGFEGHTSSVTALVVTKDNKYVVSGSEDKTIRIWNLLKKKAKEIVLQGHTSAIHSIVVTSDKKYIISGSGSHFYKFCDKTIRIWNFLNKDKNLFWRIILIV